MKIIAAVLTAGRQHDPAPSTLCPSLSHQLRPVVFGGVRWSDTFPPHFPPPFLSARLAGRCAPSPATRENRPSSNSDEEPCDSGASPLRPHAPSHSRSACLCPPLRQARDSRGLLGSIPEIVVPPGEIGTHPI
ncbi:unnamed protein product [Pleuronectes platessa]|uniref:Uncharacterized protein n=1 Tax=Pleuronectes platessa TaxID=8262 RepID=A0A9N7UEV5_PLEPL|nr:unnamed protein product [Pleuronectes platessa]